VTITSALEFLLGLAITVATLIDVFASVVVPGPWSGWLGVPRRTRTFALHAARAKRAVLPRSSTHFSFYFGPVLFLLSFLAWIGLLLLGFGLMLHANPDLFEPRLDDLSQAIYLAGSSFVTLGVSEVDAYGWGRWLILAAGLAGFSIITATVTFILQVQTAFHEREWQVLTLTGLAGRPPSGIALLEAYAELGSVDELPDFFRSWRNWSASVLHSHSAHPVLGYFQSVDADNDWLSALATVLDAATLVVALTEHGATGSATMMHRNGSRTAETLCALYGQAEEAPTPPDRATVERLRERLAAAGYSVRGAHDAGVRLARMRADYEGRLSALAAHLGTAPVALLPERPRPEPATKAAE
jgi:hypothetical protein